MGVNLSTIVLAFADQLSLDNPAFRQAKASDAMVILVDSASRTDPSATGRVWRARAFDAFADKLRVDGWSAAFAEVDRNEGSGALARAIKWAVRGDSARRIVCAEPGDAAMRLWLERLCERFRKTVLILDDNRTFLSRDEFAALRLAGAGVSETYREVRRRHALLMEAGEPIGGRWRHIDGDAAGARRPPDADDDLAPHVGSAFQAKRDLERFLEFTLPGLPPCEYLDPSRRHGFPCPRVDAALSAGILTPLTICRRAELAWREGRAPLHAAEHVVYLLAGLREHHLGLVRQGEAPAPYAPARSGALIAA